MAEPLDRRLFLRASGLSILAAAALSACDGPREQAGEKVEDVGLDAYALDPRLNPHPAADDALQGAQP